VFNGQKVAVFENPSVLPRIWIVPASGVERFRDLNMEIERLKDAAFDPLKSVTIPETSPPFHAPADDTGSAFSGSAHIAESRITSFTMKTQASSAAILVVSQTYYPGWRAIVDGKPADVLQADVTLAGIAVPAGVHEVRLVFQPLSFRIGLGLSIVSVMILLSLIAAGLRPQRKRAKRDAMPADELRKITVR